MICAKYIPAVSLILVILLAALPAAQESRDDEKGIPPELVAPKGDRWSVGSTGPNSVLCSGASICWLASEKSDTSQSPDTEITTFDDIQEEVNRLEENQQYDSALSLMNGLFEKFPENEYEIIRELAYLNIQTKQYDKCRDLWQRGHDRGMFFGLFGHIPYFKPFKEMAWFDTLSKKDMEMRSQALENSRTFYEIVTPLNYDKNKSYPLLLVLHGGGSSIQRAKKHWHSSVADQDFIVAYIQSYMHYGLKEFGWAQKDPRAREEVKTCYDKIVAAYPVDTARVVIGGISAGGSAGMDLAINQIIPANGFLGICPALGENEFSADEIATALAAGLKICIITGEEDYSLEGQRATVQQINNAGVRNVFIVVPGMGHEYPEDMSLKMDQALPFLSTRN